MTEHIYKNAWNNLIEMLKARNYIVPDFFTKSSYKDFVDNSQDTDTGSENSDEDSDQDSGQKESSSTSQETSGGGKNNFVLDLDKKKVIFKIYKSEYNKSFLKRNKELDIDTVTYRGETIKVNDEYRLILIYDPNFMKINEEYLISVMLNNPKVEFFNVNILSICPLRNKFQALTFTLYKWKYSQKEYQEIIDAHIAGNTQLPAMKFSDRISRYYDARPASTENEGHPDIFLIDRGSSYFIRRVIV